MTVCPSCGQENSPGAKFCSECGVGLLEATRPREERKVVTVLFADLVGFTAQAERLDPEDVRSVLAPDYGRLRTQHQRVGGTGEETGGAGYPRLGARREQHPSADRRQHR